MNTQPYLEQHQCLLYAALVSEVTIGLDNVIRDGLLPPCYQGVFRSAVEFCESIVAGIYCEFSQQKTFYGTHVIEVFEATTWFLGLIRCHPEICEELAGYGDDIEEIVNVLEFLASGYAHPHAYPTKKIRSVQKFFLLLWGAVEQESVKEGICERVDFSVLHELNTTIH